MHHTRLYFFIGSLSASERDQTAYENDDDDNGEDKLQIRLDPFCKTHTLTGVALFKIFIKAPAELGYAEQKINKASDRKEKIRNDKVFKIKNILSTEYGEILPYIESENAGDAQNQDRAAADQCGLLS